MGLARLWQSRGFEPDVVLGPQRRPVLGGLRGGRVQPRRRRAADGRTRSPLRQLACRWSDGRGVRPPPSVSRTSPTSSRACPSPPTTAPTPYCRDPQRIWRKQSPRLTADNVRCDWLETSHAFHSALLEPILDEFESYAQRFTFNPPQRILIDNRTGTALGRSVKLDGAYWRRHARQPVEFAKSVATLAELNCKLLLEIGPRPVLTAAALSAWPDPATAPRVDHLPAPERLRPTADHRSRRRRLRSRVICPSSAPFDRHTRASSICPPIRSSTASTGIRTTGTSRTSNSTLPRAPRPSGFSRTAGSTNWPGLLGGSGDDPHTLQLLTKLAGAT